MKQITALLLCLMIAVSAHSQTTILKIGSNGYVAVDGQNYNRGYLQYQLNINGTDTTIGLNYVYAAPFPCVYSKHATLYLDGNNGNAAFANATALIAWLNTNLELLNPGPGASVHVFKTPHITANSAYVSGNVLGGIDTFINAFRTTNGSGIIASCLLLDRANQKAPVTLLLYDAPPSHGTYTDHNAFSFDSVDAQHFIRGINFANADYTTDGAYAWIDYGSIAKIILSTDGTANLYGIMITTGTPTFNSTKNITIKLGIIQN